LKLWTFAEEDDVRAAACQQSLPMDHPDVERGISPEAPVACGCVLPARIRDGLPQAAFDPATLFGGNAHGYTDYPAVARAGGQS
jgi:hypothetical protein